MTTVLELTQSALRQAMKENAKLKIIVSLKEKRARLWEDNYNYVQKQVRKWQSLYNDLAEPLENAARYCAILPPKTLNEPSLKRPHRECEIAGKLLPFELDPMNHIFEFHRQQLHWVEAMIRTDSLYLLVHYRLQFDDGEALAYQFTHGALSIQSEKRIREEVTYQLAHAWHKEIHDAR